MSTAAVFSGFFGTNALSFPFFTDDAEDGIFVGLVVRKAALAFHVAEATRPVSINAECNYVL